MIRHSLLQLGIRRVAKRGLNQRTNSTAIFDSAIIRPAALEDIPFINQCNRKTLPENYSSTFYSNQLSRWPKLTFVAETTEGDLMGYLMGSVIEDPYSNPFSRAVPVLIGHCGSIAVYDHHRGKGVAKCLMERLHSSLAEVYQLDVSSLYCRQSNTSAFQLYHKSLEYENLQSVPNYYPDGESALYMRKSGLLQLRKSVAVQARKHVNIFGVAKM